jgi:molybdopterin biosynthesis enzyme
MTGTQRLPALLTPLDAALAIWLQNLALVATEEVPLVEALGCVAADMAPLDPLPACDLAAGDGWALRASDLVGASSYSPLPLRSLPVWVEAGEPMPANCDCVVDADAIETLGSMVQVLTEAIPGQGVRRAGRDIAKGATAIEAGRTIGPSQHMIARAAGLESVRIRRPRVRILNIPSTLGETVTTELIAENARKAGARIVRGECEGRDADSIAKALNKALDTDACDLLVTTGGTGVGRTDATIAAIARCGEVSMHGIALLPGRTAALGRIGRLPIAALPGAPDQALAVWWTIALAAFDRLAGRMRQPMQILPLRRKIASQVGLAEIALLKQIDQGWMPLSVGDLSYAAIARADGWLLVDGASEGFAAGAPVGAYMLRD